MPKICGSPSRKVRTQESLRIHERLPEDLPLPSEHIGPVADQAPFPLPASPISISPPSPAGAGLRFQSSAATQPKAPPPRALPMPRAGHASGFFAGNISSFSPPPPTPLPCVGPWPRRFSAASAPGAPRLSPGCVRRAGPSSPGRSPQRGPIALPDASWVTVTGTPRTPAPPGPCPRRDSRPGRARWAWRAGGGGLADTAAGGGGRGGGGASGGRVTGVRSAFRQPHRFLQLLGIRIYLLACGGAGSSLLSEKRGFLQLLGIRTNLCAYGGAGSSLLVEKRRLQTSWRRAGMIEPGEASRPGRVQLLPPRRLRGWRSGVWMTADKSASGTAGGAALRDLKGPAAASRDSEARGDFRRPQRAPGHRGRRKRNRKPGARVGLPVGLGGSNIT